MKGDTPPEKCPQCGVPAEKFNKVEEGAREWASEHVVGVAQGVDEEIIEGLRDQGYVLLPLFYESTMVRK